LYHGQPPHILKLHSDFFPTSILRGVSSCCGL